MKFPKLSLNLDKGALHRALGVPAGTHIPLHRLVTAAKSPTPHIRKMANFAINARHWGGAKG